MRRVRFVVSLGFAGLIGVAAVAGDAADLRKASSAITRANKALQTGNLGEAQRQFRRALEAVPGFPEALAGLGHVAMQERRFEDAAREYQAAIDGYGALGDLLLAYEAEKYRDAQREMRELEDQLRELDNPTVKISEGTRSSQAASLEARPCGGRTIALCGILADKDAAAIAAALADVVDRWIAAGLEGPRALPPAELAYRLSAGGAREVVTAPDIAAGTERARRESAPEDRIVVFGSFLAVGPALRALGAAS